MGSLWFLKLALKCIDLLSWPLLALGYPLCASIQAIENGSHSDTRNLISYWILLSLIYLFEYAFLKLLEWFQYWPYMKIMIIAWLVIPDFGRASYVYNRLVLLCISMNPQASISRFGSWKKLFVEKENFLLEAEKYITENRTEALEKPIASKTNKVRLHMEQNDIKDLEMIEKEEVPKGKKEKIEKDVCGKQILDETSGYDQVMRNVNTALCSLKSNGNKSFAVAETEGMRAKNTAGGESSLSSASKNVQKEWTCAICQVTRSSEKDLNCHLYGRKHKAACEALKAKNQFFQLKYDRSNEEPKKITNSVNALKQKSTINHHPNKEQKNVQISNVQEHVKPKMEHGNSILSDVPNRRTTRDQENKCKGVHANTKVQELHNVVGTSVGSKNSRFKCYVCNVKCHSEINMASHVKGRKHLAKVQTLTGS